MRKFMKRPSPAMLVAMTALVASFAGPAVADEVARMASHISGKHIKNGTVTGADVRNNTLSSPDFRNGGIFSRDIGTGQVHTVDLGDNAVRGDKIQANTIDGSDIIDNVLGGREINENSLTKVPSAANADKADTSDNAGLLDGRDSSDFESNATVQFIRANMNVGDAQREFTFGPFTVATRCELLENDPADPADDQIDPTIVVTTSEDNVFARTDHGDDDDFDRGEEITLLESGETNVNDTNSHDDTEYTLVAPSGRALNSMDSGWNAAVNAPGLGTDCSFFNVVFVD